MATAPNFTKPIGMETADQRLSRMQAEQAQRQVDRMNARAGTALQGTYISPQSSQQFVQARAAGQTPASPNYAIGQVNQPLINAISDGGQFATAVTPVDQYFPMNGARPAYNPPPVAQSTPAIPTNPTQLQPPGNAAIVNALRQKPNRFLGYGMGTAPSTVSNTNTVAPQVAKLNNTVGGIPQKTPGSLF